MGWNPLVQTSNVQSNAGVASQALSFGVATTSGNFLVAAITYFLSAGNPTTTSVTDNKGNTWTKATGFYKADLNSGKSAVDLWYVANATGGASHQATVTPSATCFVGILLMEFSGGGAATLDQVANNAANTSSSVSTGNVTTATGGELYIAVATNSTASGSFTANNWTNELENNVKTPPLAVQIQGDSSTIVAGTYAGTWTMSVTNNWVAAVATFKAAGAPTAKLFRPGDLSGLGSGGPFFHDPIGG